MGLVLETLTEVHVVAQRARDAARRLARENSQTKNNALRHMADALLEHQDAILAANAIDVETARQRGLEPAFIDRLCLTPRAIQQMADAISQVIALPDPVGGMDEVWMRPNGLKVGKKRIPLGVIGIIYESRPNVTSDAAALCLKSGNGVVLKGGSDAFASNRAVYKALRAGLQNSDLPPAAHDAIGFIDTTNRDAVKEMLALDQFIDVVIPRGGPGLVSFVNQHARMPVIKHDAGICHIVIDASARPDDVDAIVLNAKTQRPGVCNAAETLLVLNDAVDLHLTRVLKELCKAGVHFFLCERSLAIATYADIDQAFFTPATPDHYRTEHLALQIAVRVVDDLDHAIEHIDQFSSRHTEVLLTQNFSASEQFIDQVDSSVVMINASSRFSDGGELGLGAEIGISTTRMHAYGPMGLKELTTTKFVVIGNGQTRT